MQFCSACKVLIVVFPPGFLQVSGCCFLVSGGSQLATVQAVWKLRCENALHFCFSHELRQQLQVWNIDVTYTRDVVLMNSDTGHRSYKLNQFCGLCFGKRARLSHTELGQGRDAFPSQGGYFSRPRTFQM